MIKRKNKIILIFFLILIPVYKYSQDVPDSVLTFKEFMELVRNHHPVAKMAELKPEQGQAFVTYYRGFFDPKVLANVDAKFFNKKEYYNKRIAQLKVPTWFGLELNAGIEQNKGTFLNSELKVPDNGLVFAGAKITIGQGLITDERRTMLRKAILMNEMTQLQQQAMLNQLLFDAAKSYWKWFYAYNELLIRQEAYNLTITRLNAVKTEFEQGFRSAMDTLEAKIQMQNRLIALQDAKLNYINATNNLNNFLWYDAKIPLQLEENTIPQSVELTLNQLKIINYDSTTIANFVNLHPELLQYNNKLQQLNVIQRWQKEQLKPVVNIKYNFLVEPFGNQWYNNFNINNYKWALEIASPIFLRKQRGKIKLTNIDIQNTQYKINQKKQQLFIKSLNYYNEWLTTNKQMQITQQYVENYFQLLQGENTLFRIGESSLFKLNAREIKYVEAKIKYVKVISKNQKSYYGFYYSIGKLPDLDF